MKYFEVVKEKIYQNRLNLLRTFILYYGLFCHGTGLAILGPSLLDLQMITGAELYQVTYVIVGRAAGLGVGSLLNIYFSKKNKPEVLLALAFLNASITEASIPHCKDVWVMVTTIVSNGFFFGIVESTGTIYLISMWKKQCAPFLQAFHFSFGLGALVAPLYTRCFLARGPIDSKSRETNVFMAYAINGALMLSVSFCFMCLRFFIGSHVISSTDADTSDQSSNKSRGEIGPSLAQRLAKCFVCISGMFFIFLYCGVEISVGSFLSPFAVNSQLHLSTQTAALMSSVYWSAFTFARLGAIVYLSFISVLSSLLISFAFIALSNVFLFVYGDTLEWALWTGIVLNGIGLSAIWASLFAYISQFMPCTNTLTSLLICAACVGECVMPIITSIFISSNVNTFQWIVLVSSVLMILAFAFLSTLLGLFKRISLRSSCPGEPKAIGATVHHQVTIKPSNK